MKWYKLYLEALCYGNFQPSSDRARLKQLLVNALARRDAAANLLRSREEFYAELRRLGSATELGKSVKITDAGTNAIWTIKTLRELSANKLAPFPSGLVECKDIVDQVRAGTPYTFKVKSGNKAAILAKLRAAGATVE